MKNKKLSQKQIDGINKWRNFKIKPDLSHLVNKLPNEFKNCIGYEDNFDNLYYERTYKYDY